MQIASGEIEVASGDAIARAFACGLVEPWAPVRAFGEHVWTTVADAADLDAEDQGSLPSLAPFAAPRRSAPPDDTSSWRVGTYADDAWSPPVYARAWKLCAAALVAGGVAFASLFTHAPDVARALVHGHEAATASRTVARERTPLGASALRTKKQAPRLNADQIRRLRELDYVNRASGRHRPSVMRAIARVTPLADPHDPMNGSL